MIKFFRHIRQRLIAESRFSKYLLYAIDEIILVVIGILIALQINNWNEQRKENRQEQAILMRLKQEFETNKEQLKMKIKIREIILNNASDILGYFNNPDATSFDSLVAKYATLMTPTTFDPIENDLVGSGTVEIIKNEKLKQFLINWSTDVVQLQEVEQMFWRHHDNQIVPYLTKAGVYRDVAHAFWADLPISLLEKQTYQNPIPEKSNLNTATKKELLSDPYFEGLTAQTLTINYFNNQESATLMKRIDEILKVINSEIEND